MIKKILIFSFIFFAIPANAFAATYYVSTSGNDSNTATQAQNINTPWRTIQKAADIAAAGDIVNIKSGTYNESVSIKNSGTSEKPIVFKRYGEAPTIIKAQGFSTININQKNWIVIDGLTVSGNNNTAMVGIHTHNANNITVKNSDISGSGIGIHFIAGNSSSVEAMATSHNNSIINNVIHDTDPTDSFGLGEAIYIKNYMPLGIATSFTQNTLIENNTIYNANEAVQNTGATWTTSSTLEYLGTSVLPAHTTIRSNRMFNNNCEQGVVTAGGEGLIEEYNFIYNNGGSGTKCSLGAGGNAKNILVRNNVLFNNGGVESIRAALNIKEASGEISNNTIVNFDNRGIMLTYQFASPGNLVIKNNIVTGISKLQIHRSIGGAYDGIGDMSKVILKYNLFGKMEANLGTNYLIEDPLFINSTNPNDPNFLHPSSTSPACNKGENGTYLGAFPCGGSVATRTPTPVPTSTNSSCACSTNNTCSSTCTFNKFSDVSYSTLIKCTQDTSLFASTPSSTNKNSWCTSSLRTKGDTDGNGVINATDYYYYVSAVNGGKIPPTVNLDVDGDGIISTYDRAIILKSQTGN